VDCDDFAIGGKTAKPNENANQNGHRDGKGEDRRERTNEEQRDSSYAARVANEQIHQTNKLRNEENEGEDSEAEQAVRGHFATDIFIEQAHVCARAF
jgi:hypothetical protein